MYIILYNKALIKNVHQLQH